MLLNLFLLFACVYACAAHICMLSPPQRTPLLDINKAGSNSCDLQQGPCGKTMPNKNKVYLKGGSNFTVVFQKNLNHYNSASPGYFSVSIGSETKQAFTELYRIVDSSSPSLSLYTANISIPEIPAPQVKDGKFRDGKHVVIQTAYIPNNPKAPKAFFQCSDLVIKGDDRP